MPSGPAPTTSAPAAAPAPAPPAPAEPAPAPPPTASAAAPRRAAASKEIWQATRMRAASEAALFQTAAESLRAATEPGALLAGGAAGIDAMSQAASRDAVETLLKPVVMSTAVTKLTGSAAVGEKLRRLVDRGALDKLGSDAARPLVQERLDELTALEADPTGMDALTDQQKLAKFAQFGAKLEGLPPELVGPRSYLTAEQEAKVRLAKANLTDKDGIRSDALLQAGRRLTASLLDARLRELVEGDGGLTAPYRMREASIAASTAKVVSGRTDVIAELSQEVGTQLDEWAKAVANLSGDIQAGADLTEEELRILLGGLTTIGASVREMADDGPISLPAAVSHHAGLHLVALQTAADEAVAAQEAARKEVKAHIKANADRYKSARKDVDEDVAADVKTIASPTAVRTALQTRVVAQARAEINAAADNATSKFHGVGALLDKQLPGKKGSESGSSTAMDVVIQVPVPGTGAFLGVRIHVDAERSFTSRTQTTSVNAQLGLQAGGKLPLAAAVLGELGGYFSATGSTAAEAMEYVSYALFRRFRESSVPRELTDALWGAGGVTAVGGESAGAAKHAEANAWGSGMEDRLLGNSGHSAETGGYVRGAASVGQQTLGVGVSASAQASQGTRYSGATIEEGRSKGHGAVVPGRGAQKSVGQARRSLGFTSSVVAGTFGGSASVSAQWAQQGVTGNYAFQGLTVSLSGSATAPAKVLLDGSAASGATISKWAVAALTKIRSTVLTMQEKEDTEIDGVTKVDKSTSLAKAAPLLHKINEGTGAAEVEKGWYQAIKGAAAIRPVDAAKPSSGPAGAVPGSVRGAASKVEGAATAARDAATTARSSVVSGVRTAASEVKSAVNPTSVGSVKLTGSLNLSPNGASLSISLANESSYSASLDVVTVSVTKSENLVTVLLLPSVKVLI